MLVRNNTTTPCCEDNNLVTVRAMRSDDLVIASTTCLGCRKFHVAAIPVLEVYETIRKSSSLFPSDTAEFKYSYWPLAGSVIRFAHLARLDSALETLFGAQFEYNSDVIGLEIFSGFVQNIHELSHYADCEDSEFRSNN